MDERPVAWMLRGALVAPCAKNHVAETNVRFVPTIMDSIQSGLDRGQYANAHGTLLVGDPTMQFVHQKSGMGCVLASTAPALGRVGVWG